VRHQRADTPLTFNGLAAARQFFVGCFKEQDSSQESLWVAHLDDKARCLHLSLHQGDACGVDFPLRSIIVEAARHGTAAILLAHNHPSGDPRPSESDLRATRRLASAAEALGCKVVDHLVFAGHECTSLRRMGYL
jgi:DNA repair protein RadC